MRLCGQPAWRCRAPAVRLRVWHWFLGLCVHVSAKRECASPSAVVQKQSVRFARHCYCAGVVEVRASLSVLRTYKLCGLDEEQRIYAELCEGLFVGGSQDSTPLARKLGTNSRLVRASLRWRVAGVWLSVATLVVSVYL